MRALVVGAGAVGQVFGRHLARGGAEVSFLVKPAYVDATRRGFTMYPLNRRGARAERFDGFGVLGSPDEAASSRWDQVYFAVSSTALRHGDWVGPLGRATGDATIVFLQPNIDDRTLVTDVVDDARLVDGMIGFLSYAAPLPCETRFAAPGMAYWFPPLSPSPFSGSAARVDAVVAALRAGRLPAVRHPNLTQLAPYPNAILYAYLAALEAAGWSFATLREGRRLAVAGRAALEAMGVAAHRLGRPIPWLMRRAASPWLIRMALRAAPWVVPLPLEPYVKAHFTKIAEQVRLGLHAYVEIADAAGLEIGAVRESIALLPA